MKTKMTPAEEARAEVGAWFFDDLGMTPYGQWSKYLGKLVARLTPVFERAQYADRIRDSTTDEMDRVTAQIDLRVRDLRDRAERAESQLKAADKGADILKAALDECDSVRRREHERAERVEAALRLAGVAPHDVPTLQWKADVVRLREAVTEFIGWYECMMREDAGDELDGLRGALDAAGPKP